MTLERRTRGSIVIQRDASDNLRIAHTHTPADTIKIQAADVYDLQHLLIEDLAVELDLCRVELTRLTIAADEVELRAMPQLMLLETAQQRNDILHRKLALARERLEHLCSQLTDKHQRAIGPQDVHLELRTLLESLK